MRHEQKQAEPPQKEEPFLERWSRRKRAAREAAPTRTPVAEPPRAIEPPATGTIPGSPEGNRSVERAAPAQAPEPLPPVESLTFDSDFRAFLQPHVTEDLKREALKKLLRDPRFNVMDGLDVYIDDYSVPSPLAAEQVRRLAQARYIFDPPQTRVNEQGYVEDIPPDEQEKMAASAAPDAATVPDEREPRPPRQHAADAEIPGEASVPCAGPVAPIPPAEPALPIGPSGAEVPMSPAEGAARLSHEQADADDAKVTSPGRNSPR
jgi:hypothetical protein